MHVPHLAHTTQCRSRFWLFIGYVLAFGSIGTAATFLVLEREAGVADLWVGIVSDARAALCIILTTEGAISSSCSLGPLPARGGVAHREGGAWNMV